MVLIGAHLHEGEPLAEARARNAEILQIFLGDPQGWKKPPDRSADTQPLTDARDRALRARALPGQRGDDEQHDPHPEPQDPRPAREAAAALGARGLIVHGGH
jgi:deoxyribonuclease-4